jgi:8-oxo-dGTP pyrophosphatase MutT (NUDIX family)
MRYDVIEMRGNARLPTLSVGVIAICFWDDVPHFLMINRKDTMAYCDLVRRRYRITNKAQLQCLVDGLTLHEKERIATLPHPQLWTEMWNEGTIMNHNEQQISESCFRAIREDSTMLKEALANSTTAWTETEWEFPKGRKNYQERDQACALREFEEETGISAARLELISNIIPIEETYTGTNGNAYRHRYYMGIIADPDELDLSRFQRSEVQEVRWVTLEEGLQIIRSYHGEKRRALMIAAQLVANLRIMSGDDSRDVRPRPGTAEIWGRAHWGVCPPGTSP